MAENWTTKSQVPQAVPVERWEYTSYEIKTGTLDREMPALNRAGADGWEMVNSFPVNLGGGWHDAGITTGIVVMFKRRLP